MSYFEEFAAGYAHFTALGDRISPIEPLMRFISGATFHWLYTLYRADVTAFPTLRQLGREDLVARVEALLAVNIGSRTLGHFISEWRNKGLVHTDFNVHRIQKALFQHFDATDEKTQVAYRTSMQALADETVAILQWLWDAYPEAREELRSSWLYAAQVQFGDEATPDSASGSNDGMP